MIAASEPQEFVPFGRQHVERHPGEVILPSTQPQSLPESSILHRLSQVAISEQKQKNESWIIRASNDGEPTCEEELYFSSKTAVWSRGVMPHRKGPQNTSKTVICAYTSEKMLQHALWCTFYVAPSDKPILHWAAGVFQADEPEGSPLPSVCLIDTENIKVYTKDGEDYVSALQFEISAVWPCKYGILLERAARASTSTFRLGTEYHDENPPTIFSLLHPLDDITPVVAKHTTISNMCDPCQQIVYANENPSICVTYDSRTGLHSVWKVRKANLEECRVLYPDQSVVNNSASTVASNTGTNTSGRFSLGNRLPSGGRGSPSLCTPRSSANSFSPGRTPSPSEIFQPLAQSPNLLNRSSLRLSGSPQLLADSRLMTSQVTDCNSLAKPLYPELCFDYVWTENLGVPKGGAHCAASCVFISTDLIGHTYLCYLLPSRNQLLCSRMEWTHEQQLIIGFATTLEAKDAAPIPNLHMTIIVDLTGGLVLYSGINMVAKVQVAGIPSALTTSSYLSVNIASHFSPIPRRSSLLITSSRPASSMDVPKFDDSVHQLSPVVPPVDHGHHPLGISISDSPATGSVDLGSLSPPTGQLISLRDPVAHRVTLKYADGSMFRVSLPQICSSPLVSDCLRVLKHVLQKDVAMFLLTRWYASRNAPGTQEISPLQEWQLFISVLLELLGYNVEYLPVVKSQHEGPDPIMQQLPKKRRSSDMGSSEDWDYLLQSTHHRSLAQGLMMMLGLRSPLISSSPCSKSPICPCQINCNAALFSCIPLVLYSLHLLYEDMKLNLLMADSLPLLAQLLYQFAADLRLDCYQHHYWKDFPILCPFNSSLESQVSDVDLKKLSFPNFVTTEPPDVFSHIYKLIQGKSVAPYPYIREVNKKTRDVIQLTALITLGPSSPRIQLEGFVKPIVPAGSRGETHQSLSARDAGRSASYPFPHRAVLLMVEMGLTRKELQQLPVGVSLLFNEVIYQSRQNPPSDWPKSAYRLIARQDLVAQCKYPRPQVRNPNQPMFTSRPSAGSLRPPPPEFEVDDGMETSEIEILKLRFSRDHRVAEVRRLLQSSQPVRIAVTQRPEVSDHEYIEEQEKHLYAICTRTMALPVGRGMFTMRTAAPILTETLNIPRLCLTGRAPPRGTTVDLSHIEIVPNMNLWPLFHNGVAAGLRIAPNASGIESAWIVFNKPKSSNEAYTEHAGFLMALGLNGNLMGLAQLNMYDYLVKCHEMTSVGILLGVAATKRGTMDVAATKMMSVHMEALLPPTSIELDIQQNIQVAALLGVGLLYQGTAHRRMAEVLLSEIGRPPGPEMENSDDRESYSLAAGLALGLVVLGQGLKLNGLNDLAIPDTLHHYMVGGHRRPLTGSQKEKYKSPSYQIREGDSVNIDVTSPGATLALGMMFFNTGNRAVADWMKAPDTQYLLDFVRPDFLLLRIVSRALILWDSILPTSLWVESNLPKSILPYCLVKPKPEMPQNIDYETMNQAYCNTLAGGCMAVGLRFAGSANKEAFDTLLQYAKRFTSLSGKSVSELAGKSTIENCLNVILLSLAMVMAGTGDLQVLRLIRHLRSRVGPASSVVTYGSHLATHMALGLLFLGGGRYTLATTPAAVAAMLCAFFPKFPTHSNDNRYHLQAFRHLYVLAVEPRLLMPRDIDQGNLCYAHLTLVFLDTPKHSGKSIRMHAPCMLPELNLLQEVRVDDDRYWSVVFQRDKNWDHLQNILQDTGYLDVKQRAGCLSYLEDPHGFRSLLAQTLKCDTASSWLVRAESICAFSSDPTMIKFAQYFLENKDIKNESELKTMQLLTSVVYECVTQDKLGILPMWIMVLKAIQSLSVCPCHFMTWQLKLVTTQGLCEASWRNNQDKQPLVSPEMALSIQQKVMQTLDSWGKDLMPLLTRYITGNFNGDADSARRITSFLTFHDVPHHSLLSKIFEGSEGMVGIADLHIQLQTYDLSVETLHIISTIAESMKNMID